MYFTDIHSHLLYQTDDGPATRQEMYAMLDMAYRDGTRKLCLTPHYQPDFFGDNTAAAENAFSDLCRYAKGKYPDLRLSLACEIGYRDTVTEEIADGKCRPIGGLYYLVDFPADASLFAIRSAIDRFRSSGIPMIIAHIDRYPCLRDALPYLEEWQRYGILFQANASFFTAPASLSVRMYRRKLIAKGLIHLVASDGHNTGMRPPLLSEAYRFVLLHFGSDVSGFMFSYAPERIFSGLPL